MLGSGFDGYNINIKSDGGKMSGVGSGGGGVVLVGQREGWIFFVGDKLKGIS